MLLERVYATFSSLTLLLLQHLLQILLFQRKMHMLRYERAPPLGLDKVNVSLFVPEILPQIIWMPPDKIHGRRLLDPLRAGVDWQVPVEDLQSLLRALLIG